MTNAQRKQFDEWAVGTVDQKDGEIEFDTIDSLDHFPRVIYLRSLGYTIDTVEAYAWAEINEMKMIKVA